MPIENPAATAVASDLQGARFRVGLKRRLWRVLEYEFPVLLVGVAGHDAQGAAKEWAFRLELSGFPATAPQVQIWDLTRRAVLLPALRPTGNRRVVEGFKYWTSDTVYRPWERTSGPHFASPNQPAGISNLRWSPSKDLSFILEDLHELLNLDLGQIGARQAA